MKETDGSQEKSDRYVVFADDNGNSTLVPYESPGEADGDRVLPNGLTAIGIGFKHKTNVYGNGSNRNIVGIHLMDTVVESRLVGKLLTLIDAAIVDERQCKALKDMVSQTVYGFNRTNEETIRGIVIEQTKS